MIMISKRTATKTTNNHHRSIAASLAAQPEFAIPGEEDLEFTCSFMRGLISPLSPKINERNYIICSKSSFLNIFKAYVKINPEKLIRSVGFCFVMISTLFQISQPITLFVGALLYGLGVGIGKYLGVQIDWEAYILGQVCVTMLQLSSFYLKATYDLPDERERSRPLVGNNTETSLTRTKMLLVSYTTMTIGAVFTVLLFTNRLVNAPVFTILGSSFVVVFLYAVPPFRLVDSGYGELVTSFLVANMIPGFGFLLQTGEFHRLLPMITFPLTLLYLAMELALSLEKFEINPNPRVKSLMFRLGWQNGMLIHNALIFIAYLLIITAGFLGLPLGLVVPGLLSLPIGMFQIWQISQINAGAKPRWKLLRLTAIALVALSAYLLGYALWVR